MITIVRNGSKRQPGFVREYVGRPGPLGNPYSHIKTPGTILVSSRHEAIMKYREWLDLELQKPYGGSIVRRFMRNLYVDYVSNGINLELECWCWPLECHANVIKEYLESGNV